MVLLLKVLLPSLLFLINGVKAYCIYNYLTDGTVIEIVHKADEVLYSKRFKQHIEPGDDKCCPRTNPDCSPKEDLNEGALFEVYFRWPRYKSEKHISFCFTGGALSFYGTERDHWAVCTLPQGIEQRVAIVPAADRS